MQRTIAVLCSVLLLFLFAGCTYDTNTMSKDNDVDVTEDVRRDSNRPDNTLGDDMMNAAEDAADRVEGAIEDTKDAAMNAGDAVRENVEDYREGNRANE